MQNFTNEDLTAMRRAYDAACRQLGLTFAEADRVQRDRVAALIFQLRVEGERDAGTLETLAVSILTADSAAGRR